MDLASYGVFREMAADHLLIISLNLRENRGTWRETRGIGWDM